jgi:hypothetical protein
MVSPQPDLPLGEVHVALCKVLALAPKIYNQREFIIQFRHIVISNDQCNKCKNYFYSFIPYQWPLGD